MMVWEKTHVFTSRALVGSVGFLSLFPAPHVAFFPVESLVKGIPRVPPDLEFPILALSQQHLNPFLDAD